MVTAWSRLLLMFAEGARGMAILSPEEMVAFRLFAV